MNSELNSEDAVAVPAKRRTIADRLSEKAKSSFVGRREELSIITGAIDSAVLPFMVAFVHGPGGIGKSRFIHAVIDRISGSTNCFVLDCRQIEPTPQGFQIALGAALNLSESDPDFATVVEGLAGKNQRVVLGLDTYETFGLMDTWLRQKFIPSLPDNIFTIIAGREAPNPAWFTTPGWSQLFREIKLGELSKEDAYKMLSSRGLNPNQIIRIEKFARGFPLALELAVAALGSKPNLEIADGPSPKILQQLTEVFLSGLSSDIIKAIEAASTVRRITEPLLGTLLAKPEINKLYRQLGSLPFIDATSEGLIFQDVVRETISKELERRDPERYRKLRRRAYSYFTKKSHRAVANTLWQYTADLLYMIKNPIARGAFFPEGSTDISVEPAISGDAAAINAIIDPNEPLESRRLIKRWWQNHPDTFQVAKDRKGNTIAFYILFEPESVDQTLLSGDPITSAWLQHLKNHPVENDERVLFCPRWLDLNTGELPSPAVSACFLDIKRIYMALRPSLRRMYCPVFDLPTFEKILFPLGFTGIENGTISLGEATFHTLMNDFGPSSVDGWLAKLIGEELDIGMVSKPGRQLLTLMFTDIVASTETAMTLGDRRWKELLERHHVLVRNALVEFQGREIDTAGDGFFAVFEQPASAIKCAVSINRKIHALGIHIRAGLHLGECEVTEQGIQGINVHIGARVASKAQPEEVLISSTLKEAITGSEIQCKDRRAHEFKGIPGSWNLYTVIC